MEHVPENRMMMIQYFPVRGHSVHSVCHKVTFLHLLSVFPLMQKSSHTLDSDTWKCFLQKRAPTRERLYFCLIACVANHLLSVQESRPSFLTQPVNECRAAHPLNLSSPLAVFLSLPRFIHGGPPLFISSSLLCNIICSLFFPTLFFFSPHPRGI